MSLAAESRGLKKGEWQAPLPTDLRGPCPLVNSLANHGYIARDGRSVRSSEMRAAMAEHLSLGASLTIPLTYASFLKHEPHQLPVAHGTIWSFFAALRAFITAPFAYFLRGFGMRDAHEVDSSGTPVLNLDQLSVHNAVEHDVSLSRRDFAQGDNHTSQKDLVEQIIHASSDGDVITTEDFARLRKLRLEQQKRVNPGLEFGDKGLFAAAGEVAFLQTVFGASNKVPVKYMKAFFEEERLPVQEGWRKRSWWSIGFLEVNLHASIVKKAIQKLG